MTINMYEEREIEVTALGFLRDGQKLIAFPRRMTLGDREYEFADKNVRRLDNMNWQVRDGQNSFLLQILGDHWSLVGTN